jgi:hypothetical protein
MCAGGRRGVDATEGECPTGVDEGVEASRREEGKEGEELCMCERSCIHVRWEGAE